MISVMSSSSTEKGYFGRQLLINITSSSSYEEVIQERIDDERNEFFLNRIEYSGGNCKKMTSIIVEKRIH